MIDRRRLIAAIANGALASPFGANAQPKAKVWRIGYIGIAPVGKAPESERLVAIFLESLSGSGFVVGKNLVFDRRATENRPDRAAALAAELVGLQVDVIVTPSTDAAIAAKAATKAIPIVAMGMADPVASGLAVSLARPGGNVTGLTDFSVDLRAKRLELVKAAAPKAIRVAFVQADDLRVYGAARGAEVREELNAAAQALGISLVRIDMDSPQDFRAATATVVREHVDAIVWSAESAYSVRNELNEFSIRQRLPSVVLARPFMTGGVLMSYGADYSEIFRKAAAYVAKILNGANPADLPIERPTKVELIINLKTAKAIGLTIPESLLLRADELIE